MFLCFGGGRGRADAAVTLVIGAVSVLDAVGIDRRESKYAFASGDSDVPLGFVLLTENVMMVAMAVWMLTMR